MKNTKTKLQILEDKYFDALEEDCIDFLEWNDIGNCQMASFIKDEYIVSPREMCEYLGMPEWVIKWTIELIEEEEKLLKEHDEMAKHYQEEEPQLFSECCDTPMDCDSSFCPSCGEHAVGEPKEIDTCTEYGTIKNEPMKKGSIIL